MVYIPSNKLANELHIEKAGIWFVHEELTNNENIVAKIPTVPLKAVYRGRPFYLLLAVVKTDAQIIGFAG